METQFKYPFKRFDITACIYDDNLTYVGAGASIEKADLIVTALNEHYHRKEDGYWKERCLLAEKFIEESPGDPDITGEQIKAYRAWIDNHKSKDLISYQKYAFELKNLE